jgi:hypothetical protein
MRTDPSDNGGLFVGRRPGTAPVTYRKPPEVSSERRRRFDGLLAGGLLALMIVVNLSFWGPLPAACLWLGSQANYYSKSLGVGLLVSFGSMIALLMVGLMILRRLDEAWILVRRAAGHDQRSGIIGRVFAVCALVGAALFCFWFFIIVGPGAEFAPQ